MKDKKGLSITTLVIGIIAVLVSCCGGGFIGIVSIITGVIALKKEKKNAMSIIGLVLSCLAVFISLVMGIVLLVSVFTRKDSNESDSIISGNNNEYISEIETESSSVNESNVSIAVGDIIEFGFYEQDNIINNGKEAIEWEVLDIVDGKALLLSKYVLDAGPYNEQVLMGSAPYTYYKDVSCSWTSCTMREQLNSEFLYSAFTSEEQQKIQPIRLDTSNSLDDYVFLLSREELLSYYEIGEDLVAYSTDYADAKGLDIYEEGICYFVRSSTEVMNFDSYYVESVYYDGSFYYAIQSHEKMGIRPAIWINLSDNIAEEYDNETIENIATEYDEQKWYEMVLITRECTEEGSLIIGDQFMIRHLAYGDINICFYANDKMYTYSYSPYTEEKKENIEAFWATYTEAELVESGTVSTEFMQEVKKDYYTIDIYIIDNATERREDDIKYYIDCGFDIYTASYMGFE